MTIAQEEVRKLIISQDKATEDLSNAQKQLEMKEMVSINEKGEDLFTRQYYLSFVQKISQFQRNVSSLKEELKEAKTIALDAQKQHVHWKSKK